MASPGAAFQERASGKPEFHENGISSHPHQHVLFLVCLFVVNSSHPDGREMR